jgi:excisionase family DNA binding protein
LSRKEFEEMTNIRTAEPMLTTKDVAHILKIHEQTARRWCRDGDIPAIQFADRTYRVKRDDLEKFMQKKHYVPRHKKEKEA